MTCHQNPDPAYKQCTFLNFIYFNLHLYYIQPGVAVLHFYGSHIGTRTQMEALPWPVVSKVEEWDSSNNTGQD